MEILSMLVHKKQSLFKLMIVATLFLVCAQNAYAGKITLDRILKEHKITVVTTEDRGDVSKFLSAMNIKANPLSALVNQQISGKRWARKRASFLL
jgi:hypothetical protein